jgi:hypothetical protein
MEDSSAGWNNPLLHARFNCSMIKSIAAWLHPFRNGKLHSCMDNSLVIPKITVINCIEH